MLQSAGGVGPQIEIVRMGMTVGLQLVPCFLMGAVVGIHIVLRYDQ